MNHTEDHLLDGRIRYWQSARGHRSGIEPVLLAATVPARSGQSVLEAGTGAGAALLCLAHRVPGILGTGIEIDPGLAGIAASNFRRNGFTGLNMVCGNILRPPFARQNQFDHVLANPPWHAAAGTPSPDTARALAHRASATLLGDWIAALAKALRPRGTISLILPAASLGDALSSLVAARCGAHHVLPLWPRQGRAAKLCLIQSRKCAHGRDVILPGLILHGGAGPYTFEAETILRHGGGLMM
jgi:tRNA1Val (adenine37-N6)-methyltransferase